MPIDIHPNKGETERIEQIPQNNKRILIAIIKRLSSVRLLVIASLSTNPKEQPRIKTPRLVKIGEITDCMIFVEDPEIEDKAIDIATEKAIRPTTSSKATTCNKVLTKSPLALVCLIVMIELAGAVAAAKADNKAEKAKLRCKQK